MVRYREGIFPILWYLKCKDSRGLIFACGVIDVPTEVRRVGSSQTMA
jgi:hypothetical protein